MPSRSTPRIPTSRSTSPAEASPPNPSETAEVLENLTQAQAVLDGIAGSVKSLREMLRSEMSGSSPSSTSMPGEKSLDGSNFATPTRFTQADWIAKALEVIDTALMSKAREYGGFEWFEKQCQIGEIEVRQMFRTDIARKLNREAEANQRCEISYSHMEAVQDLAGYGILWFAYLLSKEGEE
jgi:hypothetical protein